MMKALTFDQALTKGYPEFDPDQARGEDGRWEGGGTYAERKPKGRKKPKTIDPRNAERNRRARERYRERAAAQWAAQGATEHTVKPPKGRNLANLFREPGAHRAEAAIRKAFAAIPMDHYRRIGNMNLFAVKDFGDYNRRSSGDPNWRFDPGSAATVGFFTSWIGGLIIAEEIDGIKLRSPEATAFHELAHALDYYSGTFGLSKALEPLMDEEWSRLPASIAFYGEHYKESQWGKEIFAELYTAVYAPNFPGRVYMGAMTRDEVLRAFPKTIKALKKLDVTKFKYPGEK